MSLALAIPSMFLAVPFVALIGGWVGGHWGYKTQGLFAGLLLGLAAAIRETVRILRQLSKD
jgi:hypothetical protein